MRKAARSITAPIYKSQPPATPPSPSTPKKRFYVYAIYVDGLIRYIGKGSNGRMYFHSIEAQRINGRRALGANTDATSTRFYRKLAEAMRHGANIKEEIIVSGLADRQAYHIEKQKIEELFKQNKEQLWNTIDEALIGTTWKEYKRKMQDRGSAIGRGPSRQPILMTRSEDSTRHHQRRLRDADRTLTAKPTRRLRRSDGETPSLLGGQATAE